MSLDRGGTSYRYHPLFREMLHSELRRLDPGREPELHARASAWHEEHGDLDSAIHHAVAAGNPEHSGELLWRHASSYIGHGRNDALAGWLNHFNDDQLAAVPSLAVAAASSRLAAGDGGQATPLGSGSRPRAGATLVVQARRARRRRPCSYGPCWRSATSRT